MSTVGKRIIWVGPADGVNVKPLNLEGVAVGAAILPGTVLKITASGLDTSDVASTVFGQVPLIADKDQQRTKSVDDIWIQNENMVGIQPRSGEFMNVLVETGQSLIVGTALSRNGAGLLNIANTAGLDEIVAFSDEVILTSGTELVRVRIS